MTKRVALHRLRNISKRRPIVADERGTLSGQVIEWPIKLDDPVE